MKGTDRTKFLKEGWRKIQDSKLEKERFEKEQKRLKSEAEKKRLEKEREMEEKRLEREMEEKRLEREMEEKHLEREMEKKRFERELEAKLQSEKLVVQFELEKIQPKKTRVERKNIEALAEFQSAALSQAGLNNTAAVTKTPGLSDFIDGKDKLQNYLLRFERYAIIEEIRGLFGLAHWLLVKHWMFILDYPARMLGIMTSCGRFCYRGMILPSKDSAKSLGM